MAFIFKTEVRGPHCHEGRLHRLATSFLDAVTWLAIYLLQSCLCAETSDTTWLKLAYYNVGRMYVAIVASHDTDGVAIATVAM